MSSYTYQSYSFVSTTDGNKKITQEFMLKRSSDQKTPIVNYKKTVNGKLIKQSKSYPEIKRLLEHKTKVSVYKDKKQSIKTEKKTSSKSKK